ncbi:MAG: oxidoreductase-like domain-containing protein [Burkholderiales bacterium]|nr:oxidoreductase-like domain-containing protein [Burkholderiales bacterium]
MTEAVDPKPEQPPAPEPWECCQSGCDPCVYDRYWQALTNYEAALRVWESRQQEPLPDPQDEL